MTFAGPAQEPRTAGDGPVAPSIAGLKGRLLLIRPTRPVEYNVPSKLTASGTEDRMTADIIVLDGEPVFSWYSTKQSETVTMSERPAMVDGDGKVVAPATPLTIPAEFKGRYVSQKVLIKACATALDPNQPDITMALGRLQKESPAGGGNPYWFLADPTAADIALATAWETASKAAAPSPFG